MVPGVLPGGVGRVTPWKGFIELLGGLAIFNAAMATEAVLHWAGRLISAVIPANINGSVNPGQRQRPGLGFDRISLRAGKAAPWLDR